MRYTTLKLLIILVLGLGNCSAQLSDLAKIDYTRLPKGGSEVGYDRLRGAFNYPIRLGEGNYFLVGMDYSKIDLSFDSSVDNFDIEAVEDFQLLDINFGYTFKMKGDWRFGARFSIGYSSNLVRKLSVEDAVFAGDVVFINDKRKDSKVSKPYRLIIGVSYAENRGIPFPLPFISYYRKFHPKWSYKLGIPTANLQYHISAKSRLKWVAELDGFTANIQGGLLVNENEIADKANMSIIISGLRYEYKFTKHLELFGNVSRIMSSNAKLKDSNHNTINSVKKNNIYYLRTGIRLKI
ncbi:DUF6268 family outer membrane beta-barrel protein [Zobellia uliginosa]|uniref:DUF6268 family outer membrane beta-barrel protein n=1 Tax=Zobellia uliginosa TaxID=143224 RepID=UPI001C07A8A6|nr:DUF6268 family outer membrane beta-barrel protein [Zobellia uliginosa]MBU2947159.1 hypothetical protein [Zobellia uliginosa]